MSRKTYEVSVVLPDIEESSEAVYRMLCSALPAGARVSVRDAADGKHARKNPGGGEDSGRLRALGRRVQTLEETVEKLEWNQGCMQRERDIHRMLHKNEKSKGWWW